MIIGLGVGLPVSCFPGGGKASGSSVSNPIPGLSPAAYYKFNTGITSSGGFVSQWDDQSGNARHLVQATGTNQPSLQGDGSILFPGIDEFMLTDPFTLNQPETVYVRGKQITWSNNDTICDGVSGTRMLIAQAVTSPNLSLSAGTGGMNTPGWTLDTYKTVCAVFNGAGSSLQIDNNTPTTGNPGANNAGGFMLGARPPAPGSLFAHIQVKEVVLFAAAHDASTRASVIAYLSTL